MPRQHNFIFDTKLFTILQYHLPSTEVKVLNDYKFFEQPELTKKDKIRRGRSMDIYIILVFAVL